MRGDIHHLSTTYIAKSLDGFDIKCHTAYTFLLTSHGHCVLLKEQVFTQLEWMFKDGVSVGEREEGVDGCEAEVYARIGGSF